MCLVLTVLKKIKHLHGHPTLHLSNTRGICRNERFQFQKRNCYVWKNELLRFRKLSTASVTEFRSLVGKLWHVAKCCKPAGSLMALLGSGLSSHKVPNGKQQRKISTAMRSVLQWWATFLTPKWFHNLPVEWSGKRDNSVNTWLHCYSKYDVGVWLCHHAEGSTAFTP